MQILASAGAITINDHRGSREEIEFLWPYQTLKPPAKSKTRWAVPGLSYQSIHWGGLNWSLQLSVLMPACLSAIAAVFFVHSYLRLRRRNLAALRLTQGTNPLRQ